MASHKLVPYWTRLRSKNKPGVRVNESDYFDLTSLDAENDGFESIPSFYNYLLDMLTNLENGWRDSDRNRTITLRRIESSSPDDRESEIGGYTIEAVLGYGDYGESTDHVAVDDLEDPEISQDEFIDEDARDPRTSDENRLYFFFHLPQSNPTRGITLFNKYGNIGPKSTVYKYLNRDLQDKYETQPSEDDQGLSFEMNTIASKDLIDELEYKTFQGFELVQRKVPAEAYAQESGPLGGTRDTKIKYTVSMNEFTMDRETISNLLSRVQSNEYPFVEILDQDVQTDEGAPADRVSALVGDGPSPRKRRLTREKIKVEEEIGEDIEYDSDTNRPTMYTVGEVAREIANEQLEAYNDPLLEERSLLE